MRLLRSKRESDARGCVRASDVVAEVVGRQSDPQKRVSTFRVKTVSGAMRGDGGLAHRNQVQRESGVRGAVSEGTPRAGP